jgi:hypothetical protein
MKPELYLNKLKLINIVAVEQQNFTNKIINLTYLNLTLKLIYKHSFHCNLFMIPHYHYEPKSLESKKNNKKKHGLHYSYKFTRLNKVTKLQCLFKVILNNVKSRHNFSINNKSVEYDSSQHIYAVNHIHKIFYIIDQNLPTQINYLCELTNKSKSTHPLYFEFCRNILNLIDSELVYLLNLNLSWYGCNILNYIKKNIFNSDLNLLKNKELILNHLTLLNMTEQIILGKNTIYLKDPFNDDLE